MQHVIEANGNLTFIASADSMEDLREIKLRVGGDDQRFLSSMLDCFGFLGNGMLYPILPEDVGALTEAPMLSDGVDYLDDGSRNVQGRVWWYPNYMVRDFAEILLNEGRVTFRAAH